MIWLNYTKITSPEWKVSSTVLRYRIIRICVFTVLHSKDDRVKIHYTVCLQGCLSSSNIASHNTCRLQLYMYMTECCSAPQIVKFESRFITTVDFVHNLAFLS